MGVISPLNSYGEGARARYNSPFIIKIKEYEKKIKLLEAFLENRLGINPEDIYKEKL